MFLLLDQCISINSFLRFAILQSAESEQYWDDYVGKWRNDFYDSLRTRYWVASEKVLLFFSFSTAALWVPALPCCPASHASVWMGYQEGVSVANKTVCCPPPLTAITFLQTNQQCENQLHFQVYLHTGTILTKVCNKKFMENRIEMLYNMTRRPIIWQLYLVCSCLPVINCGVVISSSSPEPNCWLVPMPQA